MEFAEKLATVASNENLLSYIFGLVHDNENRSGQFDRIHFGRAHQNIANIIQPALNRFLSRYQ